MRGGLRSTLGLFAAVTPATLAFVLPSAARQAPPDYAADIEPVFKAHCSPCHTGGAASGGLSLESYEALAKGGASGPAVAKGSASKSNLIKRLLGEGGLPRMPMGFKPLSDKDVALIRKWIEAGAPPIRKSTPRRHWAFVPPKRPSLPKLAASPIDAFILEELRKHGLKLSPPADRTTLIRRVTLDLTGLPPTPREVESFLNDKSKNAYEKVVDRLLSSPHYGERMALPWLDAARYADSNGFQQDGDTHQWVWRDWVVGAINANMPFDRFTIEQLAGDLLPKPSLDQLVATAFNRNHMLNGEGGAIPEEQRFVNLFDRVDSTSLTWMGLTMGCARCHDHKYDPLTQRDYYSMLAYFNNVPETGVPAGSGQYRIAEPWVFAGTPEQMKALRRAEQMEESAKASAANYRSSAGFKDAFHRWWEELPRLLKQVETELLPWVEEGPFEAKTFDEAFATSFDPEKSPSSKAVVRGDLADGKVHPLQGENRAFYFRREIRSSHAAPYLLSLGSDDGLKVFWNGKQVFSRKVTRGAAPDQDRTVVRLQPGENTLLLKIVNGGGIGGFYFRGFVGGVDEMAAGLAGSPKPDDLQKLENAYAASGLNEPLAQLEEGAKRANAALAKLRESLPRVMVMSDAKPRPSHILRRGNYEEPLEPVEPSVPLVFGKTLGRKDRLSLARWIVSPKNPLTARVQVNRAWQLFFGRGLVRTEENFGIKGEPPTHPKLLDWLAVDFRESGWNVKRLHKLIVMSAAYRQSSKTTSEILKKDPDNRFYARAPRLRLPSMLLRDLALASSGLLDRRLGGKPVYPYQPKGIWDGLAITLERDFTYPLSKGRDLHRRSLYTFWRRTAAPGNMFDASSRQVCTVKPTKTSSPLHALTMLNDVTWIECGASLADSIQSLKSDGARLEQAFLRICSRKPKPDELKILTRSLQKALGAFRTDPAAAKDYLTQGEFRPKRVTPELAALAAVCVSIYNLDEAMTRE